LLQWFLTAPVNVMPLAYGAGLKANRVNNPLGMREIPALHPCKVAPGKLFMALIQRPSRVIPIGKGRGALLELNGAVEVGSGPDTEVAVDSTGRDGVVLIPLLPLLGTSGGGREGVLLAASWAPSAPALPFAREGGGMGARLGATGTQGRGECGEAPRAPRGRGRLTDPSPRRLAGASRRLRPEVPSGRDAAEAVGGLLVPG